MMLAGLLLQAVALGLLMGNYGRASIARNGILFVAMACIFHGLTEVAQLAVPGANVYRQVAAHAPIEKWTLAVGVALVLFATAYLATDRRVSSAVVRRRIPDRPGLGWRFPLAVAIPLYVLAVSRGDQQLGYWSGSAVREFLYLSIFLATVEYIRHSPNRFVVAVLVQSFALVLLGSRLFLVASLAIPLSVLQRAGVRIGIRRTILVASLGIVLLLLVTVVRETVGRAIFSAAAEARWKVVTHTIGYLADEELLKQVLSQDFVYRFDGNSFPALIYESMETGGRWAGMAPLWNAFVLAVPRILWPGKLSRSLAERNEEMYMALHYGLPLGQATGIPSGYDYTPTFLGILFGYYGLASLFCGAALLGAGFARLDRWLSGNQDKARVLVGVGVAYCVILMERGPEIYVLVGRAIVLLFLGSSLIDAALAVARVAARKRARGRLAVSCERDVRRIG